MKRTKRIFSTTTDLTPTALALGSNLDHPEDHLRQAVGQLELLLSGLRVAPLFRSAPESGASQPDYLNTAVTGGCSLDAPDLLAELKHLEYLSGRRLGKRHGPRVLDIDLLLYGDTVSDHPELALPHPRLRSREFVLAPLAIIAPYWTVPPDRRTVSQLLEAIEDPAGLQPIEWQPPPLSSAGRAP